MNKPLVLLVAGLATAAASSAFAGPDFFALQKAREARQAQSSTQPKDCAAARLVLPLDHGPRAQTTPYLNEKRKERFAAQQNACRQAMAERIAA